MSAEEDKIRETLASFAQAVPPESVPDFSSSALLANATRSRTANSSSAGRYHVPIAWRSSSMKLARSLHERLSLTALGGADLELLKELPRDRARFALIGTAVIAGGLVAGSCSALGLYALGAPLVTAVVVGAVLAGMAVVVAKWCAQLSIDFSLRSSHPRRRLSSRLARSAICIGISLVLTSSAALTLLNGDIQAQRAAAVVESSQKIESAEGAVAQNEATVSYLTQQIDDAIHKDSPEVSALKDQLSAAEDRLTQALSERAQFAGQPSALYRPSRLLGLSSALKEDFSAQIEFAVGVLVLWGLLGLPSHLARGVRRSAYGKLVIVKDRYAEYRNEISAEARFVLRNVINTEPREESLESDRREEELLDKMESAVTARVREAQAQTTADVLDLVELENGKAPAVADH